jgi:hypothetical protein
MSEHWLNCEMPGGENKRTSCDKAAWPLMFQIDATAVTFSSFALNFAEH